MEILSLDPQLISHAWIHMMVSVFLWLLVVLAILLDLWDGLYTARVTKQRIHSHKLRVTVAKISEYWRLMLIGFIVDTIGLLFPIYALPYLSIVLCVGLIGVEAKSMFEHAKRRKSRTLELGGIYAAMINVATEAEAKDMLKKVREYLETKTDNHHG